MLWLEVISIAVIKSGVTCKYLMGSQEQLLDIIGEHCLTQVVIIPTRNDKTLDLLFTNAPSPENRVNILLTVPRRYFFCGSFMFLFCLVFAMFCARLFICALWSPAGKGLTSWLSFVVSSVSLLLSHWYPGSGVVLDCIDS